MTLSDRLLAENAAVFDTMVRHRFVRDIEADRLPPHVFDRYLVYEGAFVETAIRVMAGGAAFHNRRDSSRAGDRLSRGRL